MAVAQLKRHPDNSENVYYVYWNDNRWVKNWNWLDNDFNENYRVLRRKSFCSPLAFSEEFYFVSCFRHPPSMRPISANGFER